MTSVNETACPSMLPVDSSILTKQDSDNKLNDGRLKDGLLTGYPDPTGQGKK